MTIDLSQFLGKKVDVVLRNGNIFYSVTVSAWNNLSFQYKINEQTYKRDGSWENVFLNENDIVKIELSTMKKYEKLEGQIAELQKEVERLKKEEEEKDKLPESFLRKRTLEVLNGNPSSLAFAFTWKSTPQGLLYWTNIARGYEDLTSEDIIQLQKWVILSYQQQENK